MDQSLLRSFEAGCVQDEPPACQTMCPLHVDARAFAALMAQGKTAEARRLLDRAMPLSMLLGRLCSGPCRAHCRRGEAGGAVNMPLLERACVEATPMSRIMPLPATGKSVAVLGSALSSLAAAAELARKGHRVSLFHAPAGLEKSLEDLAGPLLPAGSVAEAVSFLKSLRVAFEPLAELPPARELAREYDAVYIGQDDPGADFAGLSLGTGAFAKNDVTGETGLDGVFAGGLGPDGQRSGFMEAAAQGRLAAGSVTRLLQGVAPGSAREMDLPYPSRLYTNLAGLEPLPPVIPADPAAPTLAEARAEAGRCIRCECLECVKNCAFLRKFKGYPKKYAREMYNNLAVVQGNRQANLLIDSCAGCGLCAEICPHNTDMGKFAAPLRRALVRQGVIPPAHHEFALADMLYSNSPDLAFFRHQPGLERSAYLFFPGCQLPASLPGKTEAVYRHLCEHLPGGVGFYFACCGAPARWAGQEAMTARLRELFLAAWRQAGEPEVLLACPSCLLWFREEMLEVRSRPLWEALAELPRPAGALAEEASGFSPALHDPCAARHDEGTRGAVRRLLKGLRVQTEEPPLSGLHTRCCGYGGLASAANPALGADFALDRAADTGKPMLSYCVMCRDRLRQVGKPSLHLLDLLFPAPGESPAQACERPAPGLSDRQEQRLAFRRSILHNLWNEEDQRSRNMEGMKLEFTPEAARAMEERRILRSDVAEVLAHPEATRFCRPDNGRQLACLRPRLVTFWVEYSRAGAGSESVYTVHDAYCHRMLVPGVPEVPPASADALAELSGGGRCRDITGCGTRGRP